MLCYLTPDFNPLTDVYSLGAQGALNNEDFVANMLYLLLGFIILSFMYNFDFRLFC